MCLVKFNFAPLHLERLWLFTNRIERIENLAPLGDLKELWLQDNGVESLVGAGLEGLLNLTQLCLAGNPIEHQRELEVRLYKLSLVDPELESAWFQNP
jgi:Leucine-rich repeat (LRR) protein